MKRARIEEVFFDHEPNPEALRAATAEAFGVRYDQVAIATFRDANPGSVASWPAVRWLRDGERMPGEFPVWYYLHTQVNDLVRLNAMLSDLTGHLGIAAMSQAPDPDELALHGPDGSLHMVPIEQTEHDNYAICLPARYRAMLDRAYRATRVVAS
jgi:hypothetical protein